MRAIEIQPESWHFRVYKWVQDPFEFADRWDPPTEAQLKARKREPAGLCGYFWTVVLGPPAAVFGILAIGCVALAIAAAVLPLWLIYREGRWLVRTLRSKKALSEPASLLTACLAARKARVCPRVIVRRREA